MTITVHMKHNARAWADDALERLGYPDLQVLIEWHPRFTARLGDATLKHGVGFVRLSVPLWPRASANERRETVLHEICHVVVRYESKKSGKRVRSHGHAWQHKMRTLGIEPKRCHKVNRDGLKRTRRTVQMYCACAICPQTPRVAKRIRTGLYKYSCRKCKALLRFEPYDSTPIPESLKPPKQKPNKSASTRISEWIRGAIK